MIKIYKGDIIHTPIFGEYEIFKDGYIAVDDGKVLGIYHFFPHKEYDTHILYDYSGKLIIPGFIDTHFHAPQFSNRGLGIDEPVLSWFKKYTYPEEKKFEDIEYAKKAYSRALHELWRKGTTRVIMYGTIHRESTELLMEMLHNAGIGGLVGKVSMGEDVFDGYSESAEECLNETITFIQNTKDLYPLVKPIITPRFIASCPPELIRSLSNLAKEYNLKIQTHIGENKAEIAWARALHPKCKNYLSIYEEYGLLDNPGTILVHGTWLKDEEIHYLSNKKVMLAHCPHSNANRLSGIAPIRKYINSGIPVGIGTDVSAGHNASIPGNIVTASQLAKLQSLYQIGATPVQNVHNSVLTTAEWFYLATKGGGKFIGGVGSFEVGNDFDALVIDDESLFDPNPRSIKERLERYIYVGDSQNIVERFVAGKVFKEPVIIR